MAWQAPPAGSGENLSCASVFISAAHGPSLTRATSERDPAGLVSEVRCRLSSVMLPEHAELGKPGGVFQGWEIP